MDFEAGTVLIREKKRARRMRTTHRAPLSSRLAGVLGEWLEVHSGGQTLFGQEAAVVRSRTKRSVATPLTRDHFKRTLASDNGEVPRGWHVLRHSFASNRAAKRVDQRLIDNWLGHSTEIRKRYPHLIPSDEKQALSGVFGQVASRRPARAPSRPRRTEADEGHPVAHGSGYR